MTDREKIMEELRLEINELEKELEKKKLSRKPIMIPAFGGSKESFGSYELIKEIEKLEKELERKKNLLMTFELDSFGKYESLPQFNKDDFLRPEYREGGYFTSQDYYDKCEEFHGILAEHGEDFRSLPRNEYIFLKKEFFKNTYGITWLSEEEQFLPGTKIDVHVDRF